MNICAMQMKMCLKTVNGVDIVVCAVSSISTQKSEFTFAMDGDSQMPLNLRQWYTHERCSFGQAKIDYTCEKRFDCSVSITVFSGKYT